MGSLPFLFWQNTFDAEWPSTCTDTLFIPLIIGLLSAAAVLSHVIILQTPLKHCFIVRTSSTSSSRQEPQADNSPRGVLAKLRAAILPDASFSIWTYYALRSIGCLALTGSSAFAAVIAAHNGFHVQSKHCDKKYPYRYGTVHGAFILSGEAWIQIAFTTFYIYSFILALGAIGLPRRARHIADKHLSVILLATWLAYMYRGIWPLATYTLQPIASTASMDWFTLAVLTVIGVVLPVVTPFEYRPVDPQLPSRAPNPEQTASWLSFVSFTFLDPVIYAAAKVDHLEYEQLPPLADCDTAIHQTKRSFPHLDPMKVSHPRHLFWGLLAHFHREYLALVALIFIKVIVGFAGPLSINRLLVYIETGGQSAFVRPWVWVLLLFIGPLFASTAMQVYVFLNTRNLVHIEAIVTQLVFEHSLRIRMKEGAQETDKRSQSPPIHLAPAHSTTSEATHLSPTGTVGENGHSHVVSALNATGKGKPRSNGSSAFTDTLPKRGENMVGKINNFISTDLGNITDARDFLLIVWHTPLQIAVCVWFLYSILGASAILGMAVFVVTLPLPSFIATLLNSVQTEQMKRTDARVQSITEYINVIRMIKLFAWEERVKQRIYEKREDELFWTKKRQILQLINMNVKYILPLLTMIVTFSSYTLLFKQELTASRVFSSIAVFDMFRDQVHVVLKGVNTMIQGKVSLDRLTKFLNETELLDRYGKTEEGSPIQTTGTGDPRTIGFRNATFTWTANQSPISTPARRSFRLNIDGDVFFRPGVINMIIGPTGSGKTSILMSLLGEMHFQPASPDSWYNLPRDDGVSFAPQEPWILNESIKSNILFGSAYDEERYRKILYQCALGTDLDMFEAGDETEVGEKGLNLSGGQKARISLARAIYARSQIILLDDVLSALDVHTSLWVVNKCLKGDLVRGRTILLVTHNVAMVSPIARFVVVVALDGRVTSQGTPDQALKSDSILRKEVELEKAAIAAEEEAMDPPTGSGSKSKHSGTGKLILAEEVAFGRVSWPAVKMFFFSLGGAYVWIIFLSSFVLAHLLSIIQTFWLGYWASQYETRPAAGVNVLYYLTVYGVLLLFAVVIYTGGYAMCLFGSRQASRQIHEKLSASILGTTLHWLDTTPVGRIISRFTLDIRAVDGPVPSMLADFIELTIIMAMKLAAVVYMTPVFLLPGLSVGALGARFGSLYINAQLSVKREMMNSRSPVFSHLNAAISGLPSIRAYRAEEAFRMVSLTRIDKYSRCARCFYNLNRWISFRMDLLGALFSAGLASYLIYVEPLKAADVGFSLTMAIGFSGMILSWVRTGNEFEVSCNSLERIETFVNCEQEPKPTSAGEPPAYWPTSGHLVVEKLSAAYSMEGKQILHDISFEIKSGERIGVVGRTGSGKSSLALSLLRLIPTTGSVIYDGLATEGINLDTLRKHITIIPQQPELLSGTLRDNLDPFGEYDDAVMNDALRSSGLYNIRTDNEDERITLDTSVSAGGCNFSPGQRQIIALARAICRQSRILLLDEATSAIDRGTDSIIQTSIREQLENVTVITVAHRLKTIGDSDKIMVLDAGRLVEFDTPAKLLKRQAGLFKSLVDQSGERDELYRMAGVDTTSQFGAVVT